MAAAYRRNLTKRLLASLLLVVLASCTWAYAASPARADVTPKDFEVILRSINFLATPPSGDQVLSIVYDPGNGESAGEARQLQESIGTGVTSNGMTLRAQLVPVSSLDLLRGARFAFVTAGLQADQKKIAEAARAAHILSFSRDRGCVEQRYCLVYIGTGSRVEIVVNQQAATESKIEFKPVFLMMVTVL